MTFFGLFDIKEDEWYPYGSLGKKVKGSVLIQLIEDTENFLKDHENQFRGEIKHPESN